MKNAIDIRGLLLPVRLSLAHALMLMAENYVARGRPDLAGQCTDVAKLVASIKIDLRFTAADVLAAACDSARANKEPDVLAMMERLTLELKEGVVGRVVGGLSYTMKTIGELDGALEDLRKHAIRQAGG